MDFGLAVEGFSLLDRKIHAVERQNVEDEQKDHADGVEDRIAAHQGIEDLVGRSVASHQEHIVIIQQTVGDHGAGAKAKENGKGDEDVLFFQADQP